MTDHLPECPKGGCPGCYSVGYSAALDAAREAVTAFKPLLDVEKWNGGYDCCGCDTTYRLYEDALAAIDALRRER